ncbi:MAG TPA: leucyl aminopeptidase [Alphaproteobacteria bacterium]|nr:leucyl aminopeptidase [Alphaproteobacteria bacterium]
MTQYVFENKRVSANVTAVVFTNPKTNLETLQQFLNEDEASALLSRIKKLSAKSGDILSLETAKRKIVAVVTDLKNEEQYQLLGGKIYKHIKKETSALVLLPEEFSHTAAYEMALGIELGSYSFDKYITKRADKDFPKLETVYFKAKNLSAKEYIPYAALANGVRYARDLTNEPANNMTPQIMADEIKRLGYLGLDVEILDEKRMKSNDFNLALSVAQGSENKPRVAVLKWLGNQENDNFDLGLVGKGVTFDAGGISLKPGNGMWDMKQDMAGAAAVVGAMKVIALQKLPVNVIGIVGLVENMPSGTATRPGDIVTSMSGQTVEILNTDAEGRLVLADCLWYIQSQYGVKKVIDIATLTGAIMVALGTEMAGVMGNSQTFIETIKNAGLNTGEEVWQLPINSAYNKMMDSDIADMKNISESRNAGSITAACFLQRFIQKGVEWAHLDIAGMDKETKGKPLTPKGASGFGVKLFVEIIKNL